LIKGNQVGGDNIGGDFDGRKSSFSGFARQKDAISSIASHNDFYQNIPGADMHYLRDIPSPRFSSNLGEDVEEDEEKNEIIRCILH
jgi:hypothetical protein